MSDPFLAVLSLEGVPSSYSATRDGIDALLRDRGLRQTTPEDTARSLLLGAAASASLEGSGVDADALAAGGGDTTARAALHLSTELLGLLSTWRKAPLQAIARLHAMAAAGSVPDDELGRPANPIGADRLNELARMLVQPTEAPGLVVAALVHAEIATCGAFASHAGVVARAAERLVLVERGIDPASVTVPEAGHAAVPDGYRSALAAYARGDSPGVHQWLNYASQAFARGAEASPLAS
ncbi:Fic family protein [Aeromicrobium terrae]|uniref:Oxidoreductase n=1 Tax=Aeromicrobium terrae TaxID=2498846 RepID=A0A5C8NFF5_9ACTN|nr:oxidoreductase [Aeromicrobium terrae]TXL60624.1 oxidoreductase [Aeromicrobium terrae]